jgi:hypothetical protein
LTIDLTKGRELGLVHTHAVGSTVVDAVGELIDHHALKDVCLIASQLSHHEKTVVLLVTYLIIDVMKGVTIEHIEDPRRHQKATNRHP